MESLKDVSQGKLGYAIHKCSSYSTTYVPENIQENKPHDQSSRWSSNSNHPLQYLILKLHKVSIVTSITFGKYEKTHVCNLKKFKVYGGLHDENMMELLESGLKNNSIPETFELRHQVGEQLMPCRYIKIVPLQSWGPSFNFTIWFVELQGISDWSVVKPCIDWFNAYREREVVRYCLKHFRHMQYSAAFEALARETQVQLEDPHLTQLHAILVEQGDFQKTEDYMAEAITCGMLNNYIAQQEYLPQWCLVQPLQLSDSSPSTPEEPPSTVPQRPGMRGAHQMSFDPATETIFLFGGWDGNQDLSDMWTYHIPSAKWTLIAQDTSWKGGPTARSCHKLCLDPERRQIFTLGRYVDAQFRFPANLKSDFYFYDIESSNWVLITEDTGSMGGPQLIFDHQMCMDVEKRTIYVFGGRVLTPTLGCSDTNLEFMRCAGLNPPEPTYSGLYSYHVPTNTWTKFWDDSTPGGPPIKCRAGHSMLFHAGTRKLYIFAGERVKEFLNDFCVLDIDTLTVQSICEWGINGSGDSPTAGLTLRATIDPDLDEIYVLSGLSKHKEKRQGNVQHSLWVYYIKRNHWSCTYRSENTGETYWNSMQHIEPRPRFAHQLIYDNINKVHYLFGGNPGHTNHPKLRLDDFWSLKLNRPKPQQIHHTIKLLIRKHKFVELASKDRLAALHYLQTELCDIIDHSNSEQTLEFQQLAAVLFQGPEGQVEADAPSDFELFRQRSHLFQKLGAFFPPSMTQPPSCLLDLIPL